MSDWNYQREESTHTPKTGRMRCIIVGAEEAVSKTSGKPMIIVTVTPSNSTAKVKNYIVKNDYFNKNMTQFFDAFPDIQEGNFNLVEWVGAVGAADFGLDDNGYLKVKWFIGAKSAETLPPFEGEKIERQEVTSLDDVEDDGLPFDL